MKINLVKIETRSRRETWYRVDINDKPVGLVTKSRDDRSTTNPWKAFLGIGEPQYFLGVVYAKQPGKGYNIVARETAVDAVIAAWQGLDVSGNEFEKTHGIDAVIPAWKKTTTTSHESFLPVGCLTNGGKLVTTLGGAR
jgi:hypothetical protein